MRSSSRNGHNIPHVADDENNPVLFCDWKVFLQNYFKPLKQISTYHHFFVCADKLGVVMCRESADSPTLTVNLLKKKSTIPMPGAAPPNLAPVSLTPARQWYLYDQIRQFCYNENAKDETCPKPLVPKTEIDLSNNENPKGKGGRKKSLLQ